MFIKCYCKQFETQEVESKLLGALPDFLKFFLLPFLKILLPRNFSEDKKNKHVKDY